MVRKTKADVGARRGAASAILERARDCMTPWWEIVESV